MFKLSDDREAGSYSSDLNELQMYIYFCNMWKVGETTVNYFINVAAEKQLLHFWNMLCWCLDIFEA